jgi:hypothetical protein
VSAHKIQRQLERYKEKEACNVDHEVNYTISLVAKGRGQVVGSVALNMMVLNMVVVVRVPGMTEKRIEDIRKTNINYVEWESSSEYTVHMNMLVPHERVSAYVVELEGNMENRMWPCEIEVQKNGAGDDSQGV